MTNLTDFHPVMNTTKWEELRLAMEAVEPSPSWRWMSVAGHYSASEAEWRHHFSPGGCKDIRYVDIFAVDDAHRRSIKRAVQKIHLPGEETGDGFRVFGYARSGQAVEYL